MSEHNKVLIVEDDHDFRDSLREFLETLNYSIVSIETVVEFQEIIKNNRFDIALIDVNLPDGSGHQIARFLRHSSLTRIAMLTARGAETDRLESYAAGADMHLLKPVSIKELKAIIEMLSARIFEVYHLSGIDKDQDFSLSVEDWILRPVPAALISPGGKAAELTVKDYLLIQQIMQSAERVVSPELLLSRTKFTERLETVPQLIQRISKLNERIETSIGVESPIKYIPNEGFLVSGN